MIELKDVAHFYLGHYVQFEGLKTLNHLKPVDLNLCRPFKLALRKLESMTDEEALELCKIVDSSVYGEYRFSKWRVQTGPHQTQYWKTYEVRNDKSLAWFQIDLIDGYVEVYEKYTDPENQSENEDNIRVEVNNYWQWYIDKGFDIPFLPDNKTLMESGLAIDLAKFPDEFNELINKQSEIK